MKNFEEIFIASPGVATSTATQEYSCQVYVFDDFNQRVEDAPKNYESIEDFVTQWEKDDERRESLSEARQWVADAFYENEHETLKSLRLKKGWSQTHLANLLNTSQSHVARMERGTDNLMIDTCRRLCAVLEIDLNTLDKVLKRQDEIAQGKQVKND